MNLAKEALLAGANKDSGDYLFKSPSQIKPEEKSLISKYNKVLDKLQSIGPLNIPNLQEFLEKSKVDFKHLYNDRTISDLKVDNFKIVRKLGSGAFGKVVLAELKKDDQLYAIKVIDKKAVIKGRHFRYVNNEKRILQSINFPFCIYLRYFFVDYNYLYFVMPFVPGGDFFDYLAEFKPLKEDHAKFYVTQLVLALEYLHYLELIHRDLKPENIMMDAFGYIKLADFGQCLRVDGRDRAWTLTGTPEYMAPEIINRQGYDCAVDWWALGVTLYEICAGRRPFKHSNTDKLYKMILEMKFDLPPTFSKPLTSLVKLLITSSPEKRLGNYSKGAREVKAHNWFKGTDWHAVLNRTLPAPYVPSLQKTKKG
ncbi:cAMP-dependent protein kinase catalytic subunit gamma-like [Macrosteles quadrilineatus]|uniref:cAMP-dependent protein kinase catalytic subunit gamma-like n=1 Tax=Macrosteles quadrilineatus TaxID=74068 RepID=UPI0023E1D848|nr:cAMP-dependent protein kinase catalytic subunit gamma-like [Macrosteles quadrilineatus]